MLFNLCLVFYVNVIRLYIYMYVYYICVNILYGIIFLLLIYYFDFFFYIFEERNVFLGVFVDKKIIFSNFLFFRFFCLINCLIFLFKIFWVFGLFYLISKVIYKLYI